MCYLFFQGKTNVKKSFFLLCCCCLFFNRMQAQQLIKYVYPFIGTGGHGHTYPGASVPFGMVQLSPDNGLIGWDWCSGYHYSSHSIAGFSHAHLSGTGIGDWCDISVMPKKEATTLLDKVKIISGRFKSRLSYLSLAYRVINVCT